MPKGKGVTNWAEVHAELRNKIRWAIRSVAPRAGVVIPYSEATEWAGEIATSITGVWRVFAASAGTAETNGSIPSRSPKIRRVEATKQWRLANS